MTRRITGSLIKIIIVSAVAMFTLNARAEYYLVYPGPHLVCQSHCGVRVYKKIHKVHCYHPRKHPIIHHKRHIVHYRCCTHYRVSCDYRPRCNSCYSCRHMMMRPRCNSCFHSYLYMPGYMEDGEPIDASNVYPDMATGDDNPNYDPELNIDY